MAAAAGRRSRTHAHLLNAGAAAVLGEGGRVVALRRELLHLGEAPPDPVGRTVDALAPPMLGHTLHRLWEQVLESGEACSAEVGFAAADHPATALSLRVAPVPHTAGIAVVTARDATHGRRVFQELASEVQRARTEARAWEEAAHAVAHDVRSPLATLRGFLALLQRGADRWSAVEASHLNRAAAIADAIQAVVETHLQPPPNPVVPSPPAATCDLAECAAEVLNDLRAAHPGVELSWCLDGGGCQVVASRAVVWDVLWNLLDNAVRYRHPERPLLLWLRATSAAGRASLEVRDNGRGLVAGEENLVFQRGQRGSNAGDVPGTGLGLYLSRGLVAAAGGRLRAEARPGGAVFHLELPAADDRPAPPACT